MPSLLNPELQSPAAAPLKARLAACELTIGSWITLAHPSIAEIMGRVGFDWIVIDAEHSVIGVDEVQRLIQALDAVGCPAIVRLTSNNADQIKRAMDAGATGVMVPLVRSAQDVRDAVAAVYYPPRGVRGVGLARAQGYGAGFHSYLRWLDENAVVVAMIEHVDAVERIDAILAVDHLDAFIVGPYDLSASMGMPGQIDHPRVQDALRAVLAAGQRARKPGGIHVVEPEPERIGRHIAAGFRFLGYSLDIRTLDALLRRDLGGIRAAAARHAVAGS